MFRRFMRRAGWLLAVVGACFAFAPHLAHAHFTLLKPDSWLNEDSFGGPQKGGPCGPGGYDDLQPVPMSGKVTTVHAGDTLDLSWNVTVPHTGFYRVAIAKDRSELKDPNLMPDSNCNYTVALPAPAYPVLGYPMGPGQITIPKDLTCDKCTLQVIMWMTGHPPGCIYYHCADLKILAPGAAGGAGAGGAGMGGMGGMGTGGAGGSTAGAAGTGGVSGTSTGGTGSAPSGSGGASGVPTGVGAGGVNGLPTGTGATSGGTGGAASGTPGFVGTGGTGGTTSNTKKGCSVTGRPATLADAWPVVFAALALARRRRLG